MLGRRGSAAIDRPYTKTCWVYTTTERGLDAPKTVCLPSNKKRNCMHDEEGGGGGPALVYDGLLVVVGLVTLVDGDAACHFLRAIGRVWRGGGIV